MRDPREIAKRIRARMKPHDEESEEGLDSGLINSDYKDEDFLSSDREEASEEQIQDDPKSRMAARLRKALGRG